MMKILKIIAGTLLILISIPLAIITAAVSCDVFIRPLITSRGRPDGIESFGIWFGGYHVYLAPLFFLVITLIPAVAGAHLYATLAGKSTPVPDPGAGGFQGWCVKRGFGNRLFLVPMALACVIGAGFLASALAETYRIRSEIERSTKLVVRTGGNCHRDPRRERVLLETDQMGLIRDFAAQVSVAIGAREDSCKCCGDITFDCYRGESLAYSFSLHHGSNIRIKGSQGGDKELCNKSRRSLATWLVRNGITKSLNQPDVAEDTPTEEDLEK